MNSTRKTTLAALVAVASISLLPSAAQAKPWTTPVGNTHSSPASPHKADHGDHGDRGVVAEPRFRPPAAPPSTSRVLDRAPRFRFERFPS